jgi:hypothetical protein
MNLLVIYLDDDEFGAKQIIYQNLFSDQIFFYCWRVDQQELKKVLVEKQMQFVFLVHTKYIKEFWKKVDDSVKDIVNNQKIIFFSLHDPVLSEDTLKSLGFFDEPAKKLDVKVIDAARFACSHIASNNTKILLKKTVAVLIDSETFSINDFIEFVRISNFANTTLTFVTCALCLDRVYHLKAELKRLFRINSVVIKFSDSLNYLEIISNFTKVICCSVKSQIYSILRNIHHRFLFKTEDILKGNKSIEYSSNIIKFYHLSKVIESHRLANQIIVKPKFNPPQRVKLSNYEFNPSIFIEDDKIHCITRNETDSFDCGKSDIHIRYRVFDKGSILFNEPLSESHSHLHSQTHSFSKNFEIVSLKVDEQYFHYNNRKKRINLHIFEDVKIFQEKVDGNILAFANDYLHTIMGIQTRIAILYFDTQAKSLIFKKVLSSPFDRTEKNWLLIKVNGEYFIIYTIFPLKIFKLDISTFEYEPFADINNIPEFYEKFNFLNIPQRHICYNDILVSTCWGYEILTEKNPDDESEDPVIRCICKVKDKDVCYFYFPFFIYWNKDPSKIRIKVKNEKLFEGHFYFMNDFKKIGGKYIYCFGVKDSKYELLVR